MVKLAFSSVLRRLIRHIERHGARWQALRQGRYLHLLEPYLQGERRAVPSASGFDRFCLLLVDLSGGQLAEGTISAYAPGMRRWGKGRPRAGEVGLLSMPPGPR